MIAFANNETDKRATGALFLSVFAHFVVVAAVGLGGRTLDSDDFSAVRFVGQTFEVDAAIDQRGQTADAQDAAAPAPPAEDSESGGSPQPTQPAAPPADESHTKVEAPENQTDEPLPLPSAPQAPPPSAKNDADANTAPVAAAAKPIDPFDLAALPGISSARSEPSTETYAGTGNTYGASGDEKSEILDIFAAFLKTLPLAAKEDPAWLALSEGPAGRVEFVVTIDESARLLPVLVIEKSEDPAPRYLTRAVAHNRNFLTSGRFALSNKGGSQLGHGAQRLEVVAKVRRLPADAENPQARGVRAFGLQGGGHPTGVYFTYFSGQHIELEMRRLP